MKKNKKIRMILFSIILLLLNHSCTDEPENSFRFVFMTDIHIINQRNIVEELIWENTHFITAGAVSGAWWRGPYHGFEEGFAVIDVKGDEFTWEYVDYGWNAEEE